MIEIVLAGGLVAVLGLYYFEQRAWRLERAQLLDRLMARNWGDYVAGVRTIDAPETPQLTTDEAEAAWYEAQEREDQTVTA